MIIHDTQTNVYPSAQKRKMRYFAGFVRRAIVIVPSDEEFQRRCAKREAEEGKDIPDSAVLEMKGREKLLLKVFSELYAWLHLCVLFIFVHVGCHKSISSIMFL